MIVTHSQRLDIFIIWDSVGKPLMKITVKTKKTKIDFGLMQQFITSSRIYHENEADKNANKRHLLNMVY